jgi:hypothetical protein
MPNTCPEWSERFENRKSGVVASATVYVVVFIEHSSRPAAV